VSRPAANLARGHPVSELNSAAAAPSSEPARSTTLRAPSRIDLTFRLRAVHPMRVLKSILLLIVALPIAAPAYAQHREPEHFGTQHWVFDDRFHHNHYYPAPGYAVRVLPTGYLTVNYRGGRFFYHAGVWFQPGGAGFVVVRPPVGVVVPVLPPAYATVWIGGLPYYYANDVYYAPAPGGYVVAEPPPTAPGPAAQAPSLPQTPPPPPPQAAPAPGGAPSATWYYCDSAKAYYPYAAECKEGWRSVPATPPPPPPPSG